MTLRSSLAVLSLLVLVGCKASPEQATAGNYVADVSRAEMPNVPGNPKLADQIKQALGGTTLKLRADKSFVLAGGGGAGSSGTLEGTWSLTENTVTLTPKNAPKKVDLSKGVSLTRDPAKNELTLTQQTPFGALKLVLVKNGS